MPNTSSYPPSPDRVREIDIFGKKLPVKNYLCSEDGIHYSIKPDPVKLRFSICPTSYCPAACPFCIAGDTSEVHKINLKKLETVLRYLAETERVLCVSITGGEPFSDLPLLRETISMVYEILGNSTELSLNTNGMALSQLHTLPYLAQIDAIHISRHHYRDDLNDQIFGRSMPTGEELREILHSISYRDIFVINCMLLKDYIGSPEEARRFLEFALDMGAPKVSFITCTPVNDYAKAQQIQYEQVLPESDPSILFTRGFYDYDACHCRDGIYYSPRGELIEFYGRTTRADSCHYCRGLTFGADSCLRDGFHGEILL